MWENTVLEQQQTIQQLKTEVARLQQELKGSQDNVLTYERSLRDERAAWVRDEKRLKQRLEQARILIDAWTYGLTIESNGLYDQSVAYLKGQD